MKAQELRIGNYYLSFGIDLKQVETLSKDKVLIDFNPIPLTEEWLVKFGFELKAKEFNFWGKNGWHISNTNGSFQKDTGDVIVQEEWYLFIADKPVHMLPKIQYVHQLQNLYFSLTGEELTLKP